MKKLFEITSSKLNKTHSGMWFTGFVTLSVLFLVMMNLFAIRPIGWSGFALTNAGLLFIAPVLVIQNVITEVWGKRTAFRVTIFAICCQLFIVLMAELVILLPTNNPGLSDYWAGLFGAQWRIVTASILAFAVGSVINILLFAKIREKSKQSERFKWFYVLAAVISTIVAQFIDSIIFMVFAFGPFGITPAIEWLWVDIWTSIGVGTAVQLILETTIVVAIAVHLAKWLKTKKNNECQTTNTTVEIESN
jgi:hypothetical protein